MNRSLIFDSPFLLGFEHTRNLIERAAKAAAESYPPYNVEDRGEARCASPWPWRASRPTSCR
jgi:hypothetical protein